MFELPDLAEAPSTTDGGECLVLIPVFFDAYTRDVNVYAYIRSAIYSRMTCLTRTDAVAENVSVKLYVENDLEKLIEPILKSNGIDMDKDVVWFAAPPLEKSQGGVWGRLGKKMVSYWDDRFKAYDWVVSWDADVFWRKEPKFFEKLRGMPKRIGYIRENISHDWKLRMTRNIEKSRIPTDTLLDMAGVPKDIQDTEMLKSVVGYLWCYPAKHFHEHHADFIEWLWDFAPYIGDDEICNALTQKMFGLDIFDIEHVFDMVVQSTKDFIKRPKADCSLIHGRPMATPESIDAFRQVLGVVDGTE